MSKYLISCIMWAACTVLMVLYIIKGIVTQNWPFVGLAGIAMCFDIINTIHDYQKWKGEQ